MLSCVVRMTSQLALLLLSLGVAAPAEEAFLVRFGTGDTAARDWSGQVRVTGGRLQSAFGWQLDEGDRVEGARWTIRTRVDEYWHSPWERSLFGTKRQERLSERGVVLHVDMSGPGTVEISTAQGDLSFRPSELDWGDERTFAGGSATVSRCPVSRRIAAQGAEDYVSASDADGPDARTVWQTYRSGRGDQLWTRRGDREPEALTGDDRDLFQVRTARLGAQEWIVWGENRGGDWNLFGRAHSDGDWGPEQQLTRAAGSDFHHALASDGERLYLVWQSFRDGQGEIYLRIHDGQTWTPVQKVSSSNANDWEPHVAARDGRAAIVWDTYDDGDYDLMLRVVEDGRLGPARKLVDTPSFEARAKAHYASDGRLWLAWEEGDSQWGKDYVSTVREVGMGLLMRRQVRVAVLDGDRLMQPVGELADSMPEPYRDVFVAPRITTDAAGRPWAFFRYRTNTPQRPKPAFRTMWRTGAMVWTDGGWSPLIRFPQGYGRMDAPIAVAANEDGFEVAWLSDGRVYPKGAPGQPDLYGAAIAVHESDEKVRLTDLRLPTEDFAAVHPNEAADVARLRAYRAEVDGRSLRIVRGDMHRHTDVSWDGNRDGSMTDAYRYALDAAGMDYLGVADHTYGDGNEYYWRFTQKIADLFRIPNRFAPLQGYERSRGYPSGHRNVMFAQRGERWFPFSEAERSDNKNTDVEPLYEHLREKGGIVMSHTSGTGAGTDWRDNDPEVETLVEIYQGYRTSYEHEGAPRSTTRGARPEGFVWKAWAKGLKLGLQSSSDHVSTHSSYGMIWVDEVEPAAVIDGIRARRAYAATDNILVDFRVNGALMGAAIESSDAPRIQVKVVGTGPIEKIELIRNNEYLHTHEPDGSDSDAETEFTFVDNDPRPGESWYYVRVEQEDGELAWASPVWVSRP